MTKQAVTFSARDTAKAINAKTGKDIDAKRVRQWVRDHIDAYDDDGYTAHAYNRATFDRIVAGMTKASGSERSKAASTGRKGKTVAAKAPTKAPATRKPASKPSAPIAVVPASNAVPTPTVGKVAPDGA